jgi:PAS domain-containing protein
MQDLQEPRTLSLGERWQMQHSSLVGNSAEAVSQPGYVAGGWQAVTVPTTALAALVHAGVYPDPRFGLDSFKIPDASDEFNALHDLARFSHLPDRRNPWRDPWWYRTEFELPGLRGDERAWLALNCLNYRADVWVNGLQVAGRDQVVGMFRRFRLDLTGQVVAGRNAVAILVYPVDHPGVPDTQLEVFGKARQFHKDICNDITEVMSVGYDCFPTVPDRNLGLIQEVSVEITGAVDLRHAFIRAELALPELNPARLTVSTELVNASSGVVSGVLEGEIRAPGSGALVAAFRRPVTLFGHETQVLTLTPTDAPALVLRDPELWWPNTYGSQPLYGLRLRFVTASGVSSEAQSHFGIRRLDRELHNCDGAHGFRLIVNGQRIFQRGGYVQPEMMFDWNPTRVEAELRYLVEANLNYIVFEDIPNPPDWYLDLCDRYGILFWNCFYDCYWLQYNRPWNVDLQVLEACTVDLVKRYRNHPSLILYMAQNEGETREDVYEMWRRTVLALDTTRFLVPSGSFPDYRTQVPEWFRKDLPVGLNDYLPKTYGWQLPQVYYRFVREQRNWMFMIESCSASVPPLESLVRFIPQLRDLPPNGGDSPRYPLDATWAHFGANAYYEWFDRGLRLLYGEPKDVRDYVWKAHLVTYDQHRGFFEAVHHRLWDLTSGFGEWKLNSAFPDVQWQIYDWFLRPMVSLYAIRKACARLAVQLCPLDGVVAVVNNRFEALAGLTVQAEVRDLAMNVLHRHVAEVAVAANSYREVFAVPLPSSVASTPVYVVKLELRDSSGALLADNFYWLSPRLDDVETVYTDDLRKFPANRPLLLPQQTPCFPELAGLPPARLELSAERLPRVGGGVAVRVRVANPGAGLAFFIRVRLLRRADGEEILPVFWSDNYFSLLPQESKDLTVELATATATDLQLAVDGWNIPAVTATIE